MNDNIFLDTNLLVYLFSSDEPEKREIVIHCVEQNHCVTGINNINELSNVLIRKMKIPHVEVIAAIEQVVRSIEVINVSIRTIMYAVDMSSKYRYSYFDSLVLATALEGEFALLYTEDMQHQQIIEGSLTIVNPFKQEQGA